MIIKVTDEDIKKGIPEDCYNCAISQSLKRIFKEDFATTEVDGSDINLIVGKKKYRVHSKNKSDVGDFILDFDQVDGWSKPKPIEFKIEEVKCQKVK